MTDNTNATPVSTEDAPKVSFVQKRLVAPIKKHPKIAIAIAAGVALIGVAALTGPSQTTEESFYELDVESESQDTTPES